MGSNYEVDGHSRRTARTRAKAALAELIDAFPTRTTRSPNWCSRKSRSTPQMLKAAIRRLTCKIELVPVLCGSAFKKKGVQVLGGCRRGLSAQPAGRSRRAKARTRHGQRGRSRSRTTTASSVRWRSSFGPIPTRQAGVLPRLFRPAQEGRHHLQSAHAQTRARQPPHDDSRQTNARTSTPVYAGDIAALVGLRNITTGDTLCDEDFDVTLEPPTFPEPVISHGRRAEDQGRTATRCAKACSAWRKKIRRSAVSPTRKPASSSSRAWASCIWKSSSTACKREFKVEANTGAPQIAYRETITKAAEGEGKFIRQSGGRGQYGHACINVRAE